MLGTLVKKIVGSRNERTLRKMRRAVDQINALEADFEKLSDEELRGKTEEFRKRHADGESLDRLLPEAFAAVREAAKRKLGMRHFDVQLIGGMTLNSGKIAEMRTGEGKTLVATLAAYLNAIPGRGVHVITVNDYLASRDAEWMRPVYEALGLTVGTILSGQDPATKREGYGADITYGTNNEFGFDYLRDNMAFRLEDKVQRDLAFAIIDEVDSILIDEARTPLIISGPVEDNTEVYQKIDKLIPRLTPQDPDDEEDEGPGDYRVDEKAKQVYLSEDGHQKIEEMMVELGLIEEGDSLYGAANISLMHHVNAALRAHALFSRDVDYIVKNGEIIIVDEFTGRTMPGRRWSDGLHQAVEAKEGVKVQQENQTLASITFQNLFRIYDKLSGMTGTADTEAYEFQTIYGLEVVVIPTNKPMVRKDLPDQVYMSAREKFDAIIEDIRDCHERGQPTLVGTTSIEISEYLAQLLKKAGVPHEVLNAKQHDREATIVAQAGRSGAVTIATNMAGRGTDIVLGGNPEEELAELDEGDEVGRKRVREEWRKRHEAVLEAGGLHIIGTERHESRRIDNQLRGRSGRQGDPGSTRFYLSLEDNLMRIFASDRVKTIMQKLGMQEGEAIEHPWVTRAIENAQRKVEAHNFDIRKNLLDYDDVANDQRKVIYEQRNELLEADHIRDTIETIREDVVDDIVGQYIPMGTMEEQWDKRGLSDALDRELGMEIDVEKLLEEDHDLNDTNLREYLSKQLADVYAEKEEQVGEDVLHQFEKAVMLQVVDSLWKEHLAAMDYLRQGIHLQGFAQKDPKQEYKRQAFEMFSTMLDRIKHETVTILAKVQVRDREDVEKVEEQRRKPQKMNFQHAEAASATAADAQPAAAGGGQAAAPAEAPAQYVRETPKVGRNEPCPCGSGKKYKHCHGALS